jgi:hypothetical protein
MAVWIMPPLEPMIEPIPVQEIRVDSINGIELIDSYVRAYLVSREVLVEAPNAPEHLVLRAKLIGPASNVPLIMNALAHCLKPQLPRLVK